MSYAIRSFSLSLLACLALTLGASSTAWSQVSPSQLVKYAPKSSGLIVGVDVKASKDTFVGKAVFDQLSQSPKTAKALTVLSSTMGIEPKRDIKSVVFAGPAPRSASAKALSKQMTLAVSGTFKKAALLKGMQEAKYVSTTVRGLTVYAVDSELSAAMINTHTIVFVRGASAYTKKTWKHVAAKAKSGAYKGKLKSRLKQTDLKSNVFVVTDAVKFKQPKDGPQLRYAMIELDLQKGMQMAVKMELTSEKEATQGLEDLEAARPNAASLSAVVGVPGVVQKLTMTQKGKNILLKTTASPQETARIITLIKRQMGL